MRIFYLLTFLLAACKMDPAPAADYSNIAVNASAPRMVNEATKVVPDEQTYMDFCVSYALKEAGGAWPSSIDQALESASCTCVYQKIKVRPDVTEREYADARMRCDDRLAEDPNKFVKDFLK